MRKNIFKPKEILFSPLSRCNLFCPHCDIKQHPKTLAIKPAVKFLHACSIAGIKRVSFTGGEPFLALNFITSITRQAIKDNMLFGRITTNGVWFKNKADLLSRLKRYTIPATTEISVLVMP